MRKKILITYTEYRVKTARHRELNPRHSHYRDCRFFPTMPWENSIGVPTMPIGELLYVLDVINTLMHQCAK